MAYKGPIQLIREFDSERDEIVFQTRENFLFVNKNGGTEKYSLAKLSAIAKKEIPELNLSQTSFQHFLEGKVTFLQKDLPPIIKLLELSIRLRDEVEPHVQAAQKMMEESRERWRGNTRLKSPKGMS
jgi:hypothetical protein